MKSRFQLLLPLFLIGLIFCFYGYSELNRFNKYYNDSTEYITKLISSELGRALFNIDEDEASMIVETSAIYNQDIYAVIMRYDSRIVFLQYKRDNNWKMTKFDDYIHGNFIIKKRETFYKKTLSGFIDIYFVKKSLTDSSNRLILNILILYILIVLIFIAWFYRCKKEFAGKNIGSVGRDATVGAGDDNTIQS